MAEFWKGWWVVLVLWIWWIWEFFVYPGSSSTGVKSVPAIGGYVFPRGMVAVVGYNDGGLVRKKDPVVAILFF